MSNVALGPAQRPAGGRPVSFKPRLLSSIGQRCPYCSDVMTDSGDQMVSRDHVLSRMRMRKLGPALRKRLQLVNCIVVCFDCNNRKGSMTLFRFMTTVGGYTSPMGRHIFAFMGGGLRARLPAADFLALTGAPE